MSATEMSHADQVQETAKSMVPPPAEQAENATDTNIAALHADVASSDQGPSVASTPATKKELDAIFTTAVTQLFADCDTAIATCATPDDVVKSFHQTLLRILATYAETYKSLGSSTWAPKATAQHDSLEAQHIDYSQDAKRSAIEQFNQILKSTQDSLSGGLAWQAAAGVTTLVTKTAYYVTLPVLGPIAWLAGVDIAPQFGSVLQNTLVELKGKFDAAIKPLTQKQAAARVDATEEADTTTEAHTAAQGADVLAMQPPPVAPAQAAFQFQAKKTHQPHQKHPKPPKNRKNKHR